MCQPGLRTTSQGFTLSALRAAQAAVRSPRALCVGTSQKRAQLLVQMAHMVPSAAGCLQHGCGHVDQCLRGVENTNSSSGWVGGSSKRYECHLLPTASNVKPCMPVNNTHQGNQGKALACACQCTHLAPGCHFHCSAHTAPLHSAPGCQDCTTHTRVA